LKAIERWFLTPQTAHWAVAMRIAIGLILACWFIQVLPHARILLGPNGIGRMLPPGTEPSPASFPGSLAPFAVMQNLPSDGSATALVAGFVVLALLFTVGFRTRTTGVLLAIANFGVWGRAPLTTYGWPQELGQFLVILLFANPGRYVSVDAWLRERGTDRSWREVGDGAGWPLRLAQIHVTAMYAASGFPRLDDWAWLQGYTVFVAVSMGEFTRLNVDWWPFRNLLALLNWGVVLLEPLAVFALWIRPLRGWMVLGLLGMHAGLELTTHVGWWQWTMAMALVVFVSPPLLTRVSERLGLRTSKDR
jgi:hypothetical protein